MVEADEINKAVIVQVLMGNKDTKGMVEKHKFTSKRIVAAFISVMGVLFCFADDVDIFFSLNGFGVFFRLLFKN